MKKELDELITVLDDAVDMQDDGKYQDLLDSFYQDGLLHEFRRHLNKQAERVRELEFRNKITENRNFKLEQTFKDYQQVNKNMYDMIEDLKLKNLKIEQQNKLYREAREKIDQLHKENYVKNVYGYEDGYLDGLDTAISIIDEALEGEE